MERRAVEHKRKPRWSSVRRRGLWVRWNQRGWWMHWVSAALFVDDSANPTLENRQHWSFPSLHISTCYLKQLYSLGAADTGSSTFPKCLSPCTVGRLLFDQWLTCYAWGTTFWSSPAVGLQVCRSCVLAHFPGLSDLSFPWNVHPPCSGQLGWSLMLFVFPKLSRYFFTLFSCDFIPFVNPWALLLFLQYSQVPAIWLLSLPHHMGADSNHPSSLGIFIHSIIRSILSHS